MRASKTGLICGVIIQAMGQSLYIGSVAILAAFYDGWPFSLSSLFSFDVFFLFLQLLLQGESSLAKSSTVVDLLSDQSQVHNKAMFSPSRIFVFGYLAWEQQSATSRWRYKQSNWTAILVFPCRTTNVNQGKFLLTDESMANTLSYGRVSKGARTPQT